MFTARAGTATIGRHVQPKIPHLRIVSGTQDATIGSQSAENQRGCSEIMQKNFEWSLEERGMHGFEYKVVFVIRPDLFNKVSAGHSGLQAVIHEFPRVRVPVAEIVIDVDRRNTGVSGPLLKPRKFNGGWHSVL